MYASVWTRKNTIGIWHRPKNNCVKFLFCPQKGKLPKHYLSKPSDRPEACLTFVPNAPRTVDLFPMSWDWDLYNTKPRVLLKSRSSLQTEKEEFESTRKTVC